MRPRGLLALDFDSTLIEGELIDELARAAGALDEVAALTRRAMEGELDFEEAMRRRLRALAGLPGDAVDAVAARVRLRPGARETFEGARDRGYGIVIISGSFHRLLVAILERESCRADYVFANDLAFARGRLAREAVLQVRSNKGEILRRLRDDLSVPRARTVAVGDGATDVAMFAEAAFGIAIGGKRAAREAAAYCFDGEDLRAILHVLPRTDSPSGPA